MLAAIERKIAAVLGDGMASRLHLDVMQAPAPAAAPAAGKGLAVVSIGDVTTAGRFEPDFASMNSGSTDSRRVLPVSFTVLLDFFYTPAAGPTGVTDMRALQLDDLSLAAHLLAAPEMRTGSGLASAAADPGYRVLLFRVDKAAAAPSPAPPPAPQLPPGTLTAVLTCTGEAELWPPGVATPQGTIAAVDTTLAALPLQVLVDSAVVFAGGDTKLRLRSFGGQRLTDPATGAHAPLALAVTVTSDLPPAQRGAIVNGTAGVEMGVRIILAGDAETVIVYHAPEGSLGTTRTEYVAIHMATPDNRRGVFLGSAAVNLLPKTP